MDIHAEDLIDIEEKLQIENGSERDRSSIERIQAFGRALYNKYEIKQFLLVTTKEFLFTKGSP